MKLEFETVYLSTYSCIHVLIPLDTCRPNHLPYISTNRVGKDHKLM